MDTSVRRATTASCATVALPCWPRRAKLKENIKRAWPWDLLAAALVLCKAKKVRPCRLLNRGPGFWAAAGLGVSFLAVGGLAALDFDRAFVIFHSIFFPGKDNWIFDWRTDPIILFLPQDFFRNCAVLILALLLLWCAALIAADLWAGKRRKPA